MIFSQKKRIAIVEFWFASKAHCRVTNAFQQKYPGETAPNASTITRLVQGFRDTESVADRKRSGRASIVKTKGADVETVLQRSSMKVVENSLCSWIYHIHQHGEQHGNQTFDRLKYTLSMK
ncbi:DUF4817 domain-containing protein [Trichonephila clavata]|uniref:DUF4817 domain-containing protein n=1 Tax=Trichonephila clavata TaxID=2740835 RepID=A0A8X6M3W0_TRICU|nr:DUF4817 domain-containing protein [Trichonephila clavata]